LQRQGLLRISHGQEERTNGAYGSSSQRGYRFDRDDTIRDGRFLDTPDKMGNDRGFYCSSSLERHHFHHHHHSYNRSENKYFPEEFKK